MHTFYVQKQVKERITYWDVARGLAMLLVIFYHVPLYIRLCHPGAAEMLAPHISAGTWILPFFMPVFFVISGYFVNTAKNYWQFLWSDVKNLLLVGLLLSFVNVLIQTIGLQDTSALKWFWDTLFSKRFLNIILSNWFISAIFFARQIYYWTDRLTAKICKEQDWHYWTTEFVFLTAIAVAGILIEPYACCNSRWFYCQGLVFAIFLAFGKLLHEYPVDKRWLFAAGGGYIVFMAVARMTGISTLEYGMINSSFTLAHWPFYMLLALSGSALLIALAQLVNRFQPVEFIGRHTLVFYIPQGGVLLVTATLLGHWLMPDTPAAVWIYIGAMWVSALLGLGLLSWAQEGWQRMIDKLVQRQNKK